MTEHQMHAAELPEVTAERRVANEKTHNHDNVNLDLDLVLQDGHGRHKGVDALRDSQIATESESADEDEPTELEKDTLRRIGENVPLSAWLVAVIELSERFTFYGCQGLFQNYIQRPLDGSLGRGALGMGHQKATALNTFFSMWCYCTPIIGAIVADQYLGRYKTIVYFAGLYIIGLLILFSTSLSVSLENGAGLGGFIAAILIIGLGTGGIKANVSPLIADQYARKRMAVKMLKTGERVIIDPAITYQRIYLVFYCCINIGALSLLATPYMEREIGYWSAFLLCLGMFCVGFVTLIIGRKRYVVRPPKDSVITDAFRAIGIMIKHRNLDAPKPTYQEYYGRRGTVPWDDQFIDELKRALVACRVFIFYPIYWVTYSQFSGNFVSQAAQMAGHGIPNDLMQNFDPIAILFFAPIIDRTIYPFLQKMHIPFRPIARISLGFVVASLSMAYAAIVQHLIYQSGPCYGQPLTCPAAFDADGVAHGNNIHIAIQTPAYLFIGISEIFASVSGLEYAYMKAPPSMKSFVQAIYLLTNAFGYALGEAFTPLVGDPKILWLFVGLACGSLSVGVVFYALYYKLDRNEDEMNMLDAKAGDLTKKRALEGIELHGSVSGNDYSFEKSAA